MKSMKYGEMHQKTKILLEKRRQQISVNNYHGIIHAKWVIIKPLKSLSGVLWDDSIFVHWA